MGEFSGSLNRILQNVHQEVQNFAKSIQSGDQPVSKSQTDQFIRTLQQKTNFIQNAAKGDVQAAKFSSLNSQTLDGLAKAIVALGTNAALARQLAKPEQHANLGNVLLGLGEAVEKMRRKKKEGAILKKGYKVERYEIVEFLNATEKEFERHKIVIKEEDEDEDLLLAFMREIIRRMQILKMLKKMPSRALKKLKIPTQQYNRILKLVRSMTQEESFRKKVYQAGMNGATGNSHLRFWKALKEFQHLIEELK